MPRYDDLVPALLQELSSALHSVNANDLEQFKRSILEAKHIFIAGKGRSGLQMRAFAMRLMHLGLAVHVVDDVTTPALSTSDLLVIGSGSGRTASLVNYAQKAKAVNARIALVTITPASPIGELADVIVRIEASTPKLGDADVPRSIQPMGNLFEQSLGLLLDITTMLLMADLNQTSEQMFTRHANLE
jgi:6-phospho-3-hexuloisomerase